MTFDYDYGRVDLIIYRTYIVNEAGEPFLITQSVCFLLWKLLGYFVNINRKIDSV